ncbi:MAG: gamma-glutamylcyclotransferase family protein [bacterium]
MDEFLFVYGTLRNGAAHPMLHVLNSHAVPMGPGRFCGRLYDLGPYPAAVADPSGQWQVVGEVYRILQPSPLFQQLDLYEGCAPDSPGPHEYRRSSEEVLLEDGRRLEAWIYLYLPPPPAAGQIESGDYLEGIA